MYIPWGDYVQHDTVSNNISNENVGTNTRAHTFSKSLNCIGSYLPTSLCLVLCNTCNTFIVRKGCIYKT